MLRQLLLEHARRYPMMQPIDYAKLIYQAAFAGGHLIPSPEYALNRLRSEWNSTADTRKLTPLIEPIGNGISRLYIAPARRMGLRPETVNALFVQTSVCFKKNPALFEDEMAKAAALADAALLPVSGDELRRLAHECRQCGYAPFSHSADYRAHYEPAYRLILDQSLLYLPVFAAIDALLIQKNHARIAIDGGSASGKSTLGALLCSLYDGQLFHMDDFFLPPARKTPARLSEPGGNVDYERFQADILNHLDEECFAYRPYRCHENALGEEIKTQRRAVQIIEGCYSHHPRLQGSYDLLIVLMTDQQTQSRRILDRNGPALHRRFINEWIPLENRYFEACSIASKADFLYTSR